MYKYVLKHKKKSISFIILIIIFFIIFLILNYLNSNFIKSSIKGDMSDSENFLIQSKNIQINSSEVEDYNWYLEIPNINLKAQINNGTTKEVMDKYIGHFDETPKLIGNVGLAAHNRGYENNYFHDLKKLKEGDEIVYTYKDKTNIYEVIDNKIIEDTNSNYLENTEQDTITLITCVENEPNYRRCVQGIVKIEK